MDWAQSLQMLPADQIINSLEINGDIIQTCTPVDNRKYIEVECTDSFYDVLWTSDFNKYYNFKVLSLWCCSNNHLTPSPHCPKWSCADCWLTEIQQTQMISSAGIPEKKRAMITDKVISSPTERELLLSGVLFIRRHSWSLFSRSSIPPSQTQTISTGPFQHLQTAQPGLFLGYVSLTPC